MTYAGWRRELDELLGVCERRADRAAGLPHCAICARYANSSPAFDAVLSLLERLPPGVATAALADARRRLAVVPAALRTQQVCAATFGPLLDTPGWPLVGHLVIDVANEETARHLSDPRLAGVEELTVLGFAYGNATAGSAFTRALVESALDNVRVLRLHSADLAAEDLARFWSSPFAARLEQIEGATYRGEPLPHPLRAAAIGLRGAWDPPADPAAVLRLLTPDATPRLKHLGLGSHYAKGAAPGLLRLLGNHREVFERVEDLAVDVYGRGEESDRLLAAGDLPRTVRTVAWSWLSSHGTTFPFNGAIHTVAEPARGDTVGGAAAVTDLPGLAAELAHVGDLPRGLRQLRLIAPPDAAPADLVAAVGRFPALEALALVYPFRAADLPGFLAAVRHLARVELYLTMRAGCSTTEYAQKHAPAYRSDATAEFLLRTALAARDLSLYADTLDVSRTPAGFEHLTLKTATAVRTLARLDPDVPIESLTLETPLTDAGASSLVRSGVLSRVYRLTLREGLSDGAAATLAVCSQLRTVREFRLSGHGALSRAAFDTLIESPHLAGVLDLSVWGVPAGGDAALATAPLLPGLVALDLHGCDRSEALPASGRLTRLRAVSEWLTMSLLEDGRLTRRWLASGAAVPLAARLRAFLEWVYRVPAAGVPELIAALEVARGEEPVREAVRDLIAAAFGGRPVPEEIPLTIEQRAALQAVAGLDGLYWSVGGLLSPVFKSYGLPPFSRDDLKKYLADRD